MGYSTAIEWTNHTFNPWWGCTNVSAGCDHCYAQAWAQRFGNDLWGNDKARRTMGNNYWLAPLGWNAEAQRAGRRSRVFCASMADVFDPQGPETERVRLWDLIKRTPWLDWQLLTKRPALIARYLPADWRNGYPNVWLGTSIENEEVLYRVDQLTAVPAIVHFLSLEPLIGPLFHLSLDGIEWAIVGGESGPTPRPMEADWVRDIRAQCDRSGTSFFFKQWGGRDKKARGRELDGKFYDALPRVQLPANFPQAVAETEPVRGRSRPGAIIAR